MRFIFTAALLVCLTACATKDKPLYYLNDASLRIFQSGDKLTYSVLDESIYTYSVTLTPRDELPPTKNNTIELLYEDQAISGNLTSPFLPLYIQQNTTGDLLLRAIGSSGEVLWLMNEDNTEANEILYPSNLNTLTTTNSFSRKLQRCNIDKECTDAGHYKLLNLKLLGTETVETSYADFEAYKLEISVEIEISDPEQAGNSKLYSFSGTQWIHPLIGVIKFIYNTTTPSLNSLLIGPLSNTNISIDESYKTRL